MNPAFHRKCLKDFVCNFNNVCDMFLTRMSTVVNGGILRIPIPHSDKQHDAY